MAGASARCWRVRTLQSCAQLSTTAPASWMGGKSQLAPTGRRYRTKRACRVIASMQQLTATAEESAAIGNVTGAEVGRCSMGGYLIHAVKEKPTLLKLLQIQASLPEAHVRS